MHPLPDHNIYLRPLSLHRLLRAGRCCRVGDGNGAFSRGFGLESKDANHACSAHTGDPGRTRSVDHDGAGAIVTVHQRHRLSVAVEKVAVSYIDRSEEHTSEI